MGAVEGGEDRRDLVLRARLKDGFLQVLRSPPLGIEETVEQLLATLRGFYISERRKRPRSVSPRALARRLPPPGTRWPHEHKGREYHLRILGEHVECECNGLVTQYETLKQAACGICGYAPSVSGWRWFFGPLTPEEVAQRYGEVA